MSYGFNFDEMSEKDLQIALPDSSLEDQIEIWRRLQSFAWERREFGSVTAITQNIYDLALKTNALHFAANAKYTQGSAHFNLEEFEPSKDAYLECAKIAGQAGLQSELANALWAAADASYSLLQYEEALSLAKNSEEIAKSEELFLIAGRAAFLQMKALYYLDQEPEALEAGSVARGYFRQIAEIQEVAKVDDYAITILFYLGHVDEAVEIARDVLLKWSIQGEIDWIAYSNYRLAVALKKQKNFEESNYYLQIAKNKYLEAGIISRVAECEYEIGDNCFELDQFEEAIEKFLSAKALWDGVGNDWGVTKSDAIRAICLHNLDRNSEAKKLNLRILSEIEEIDQEKYQDMSYVVRARAADNALNDENYEEVLQILKDGPDFGTFQPSTHILIWRLTLQARALYALGRDDEALVATTSAMELTDEDSLNWNSGFIYEIRGNVLLKKERPEAELHLAHAIALHLANGYTDRAAELSKIFIPKIQRRDVDALAEIEVTDASGDYMPAPDDLRGEVQDFKFGFSA